MVKYILGVSGWPFRSHDAAAALIRINREKEAELVGAAEEERFIREKHAFDKFPHQAIKFLLNKENITPSEIDYVALGWDYPLLYKANKIAMPLKSSEILLELFPENKEKLPVLKFSNHHFNHASSAFRLSGFKEAAIFVIDGQGELDSTTIWHGKDNDLKKLHSINVGSSLGYMYESVTVFAGFDSFNAGKAMGLAPYGNPSKFYNELLSEFELNSNGYSIKKFKKITGESDNPNETLDNYEEISKIWFSIFEKITGKKQNTQKISSFFNFPQPYCDLVASVQKVLETVVIHLVKEYVKQTGCKKICMAGGVALNCVANGKLLPYIEDIFVQPASNDAGNCIGAAMQMAADLGYYAKNDKIMSPYLGPEYTDEEIKLELKKNNLKFTEKKSCSKTIAKLISEGNVVAVFQGRMEIGPRALGSRSFLADPRNPKMWSYINKEIKHREEGRPLAPSILYEKAGDYLVDSHNSPYMNLAFQVVDKSKIPAVTHVDNSTRPQTVTSEMNPVYYEQIKAFGDLTGVYVLLNTSLNDSEPIVCSPADAIRLLKRSKVDYMVFNNRLMVKNQK